MTLTEARTLIMQRCMDFPYSVAIQYPNQPDFTPPNDKWCRVSIQYADTQPAGFNTVGLCERDGGYVNIQCFVPKGTGDIPLVTLADQWRAWFKGYRSGNFEVTITNAPTEPYPDLDGDYVMSLVRIEFRVN